MIKLMIGMDGFDGFLNDEHQKIHVKHDDDENSVDFFGSGTEARAKMALHCWGLGNTQHGSNDRFVEKQEEICPIFQHDAGMCSGSGWLSD